MTKNTETKRPVELNDDEMEQMQGGIVITGAPRKPGAGIIVVDEDGIAGPSDQFPG